MEFVVASERFWGTGAVGWAAISAVGILATLAVAMVAAGVALGQLRESRRLAKERARPYVIVDFEPSPASNSLRDFVVRNIGQTPPYGVSITWDPPPIEAKGTSGHLFQDVRAFNEPTPMLAPSRELRFFFDSMIERSQRGDLASVFEVTVAYRSSTEQGAEKFREITRLDMELMKGSTYIDVKAVHHLVQELERLRKVMERSAIVERPMEVITESRSAYISRREAEYMTIAQHDELESIQRRQRPKRRG